MVTKRHLWFPVFALVAGLCMYCGEDKGGGPDGDGSLFEVELEHYFSSYDDPEDSGIYIRKFPCGNASNDSSVYGLDVSGEWIMVSLDIPEAGTYVPHLNYAAPAGQVITVRIEMDECGGATVADFLLNDGTGTG
jgi:hypothetical protein